MDRRRSSLDREAELNDLFQDFDSYTFQHRQPERSAQKSEGKKPEHNRPDVPSSSRVVPKGKKKAGGGCKSVRTEISDPPQSQNSAVEVHSEVIRRQPASQSLQKDTGEMKITKHIRQVTMRLSRKLSRVDTLTQSQVSDLCKGMGIKSKNLKLARRQLDFVHQYLISGQLPPFYQQRLKATTA